MGNGKYTYIMFNKIPTLAFNPSSMHTKYPLTSSGNPESMGGRYHLVGLSVIVTNVEIIPFLVHY